ncbi:MAG: GNAT family protein [Pseudomonadota bacterium]
MTLTNDLGQPIGAPVPGWTAPPLPPRAPLTGRYVRLEPQTAHDHLDDLWAAFSAEPTGADWTHRFIGPFADRAALQTWMLGAEQDPAAHFFAYVDTASGKALGNGSFMSMDPAAGSIEVGAIMFSRALQRTCAATEAIFLHMQWAFDAGYRRFEWTCDPLNTASMGAAERFGFSYEATFRSAYVAKGRNRDKAVFAIIDRDWPAIRTAFQTWLDPANFDADGQQRQSLRALTAPHVTARTTLMDRGLRNDLDQPVDHPVPGWTAPPPPTRMVLTGRYCQIEPLCMAHTPDLHDAYTGDRDGAMWTYLTTGPHADLAAYQAWAAPAARSPDPLHFAITVNGRAIGTASYLRIAPSAGSIEVGWITYSPALQRTRAATEAMFLMMAWAFEAGYRRYEWKCNALNAPSRRAAGRLGFSFEGVFRQATIARGQNRDTAWFAATDAEWPALQAAFRTWLDPANFDADGQQRQSLSALTRPILVATD